MKEGTRVRLIRDVERFPHCFAHAGQTGTYVGHRMGISAVRMDAYFDGLDEWQNCLEWYDEETGPMIEDVEILTALDVSNVEFTMIPAPERALEFVIEGADANYVFGDHLPYEGVVERKGAA